MAYDHQTAQVRAAYRRIYGVAHAHSSTSAEVCTDFLFAWYNARAWGGWNPQSIVHLDQDNADALLVLLTSFRTGIWYPPSTDMDALSRRKGRKRLSHS